MSTMQAFEKVLSYELFKVSGIPVTTLELAEAALALLLTALLAHWVSRLCEHRLRRRIPMDAAALYVLIRLTHYSVWAAGLLISLRLVHISLTGLAVIGGGLGIGLGFGLQSIVSNFVAGLILLFQQPIKLNDFVTIENVEGVVVEINSRATRIVTNDSISIIVPNAEFINRSVVNWSHGHPNVRIRVPIGVAYGTNVELVRTTLLDVAANSSEVLSSPAPTVRLTAFGDSAMEFELLAWTATPVRHEILRSEINWALVKALAETGISIPFPQRDLHIRSEKSDAS